MVAAGGGDAGVAGGFEDGDGEVALSTWPFTDSEYAACENLLGTDTQPDPARTLTTLGLSLP